MSRLDLFESAFRAAAKPRYTYREIAIRKVLVVTDLDDADTAHFTEGLRPFLSVLEDRAPVEWRQVAGSAFHDVAELLTLVEDNAPDLICTYRNLHSTAWRWPYTLGSYLMALTQEANAPVMVLPHPGAGQTARHALQNTDQVMAVTDHLRGDSSLVSTALIFLAPGGTLHLAHVEDAGLLARLFELISRIPSIETEQAKQAIEVQLLKEPQDYLVSVREALQAAGLSIELKEEVTVGKRLAAYKELIARQKLDLLVFHARDADQMAMHGLAYPLAIELREIPLLLM